MARKARFGGITLDGATINYKRQSHPVGGAVARIETAGQIRTRISATRTVASLGLGLLWRKKVDERELYVTITGPTYEIVVSCDPDKGKKAREFAATVNSAALTTG